MTATSRVRRVYDDSDSFEIMLNGFRVTGIQDEATERSQDTHDQHVESVNQSLSGAGDSSIPSASRQEMTAAPSSPALKAIKESKAKCKSKKIVPGTHFCSELEKENVLQTQKPQKVTASWTEVEDGKNRKIIYDAKKKFDSLSPKWKDGEPNKEEVRNMIQQLKAAIQKDDSDYRLYYKRAQCYLIVDRFGKALRDIERALTKIPEKNRQTFAKVYMRKAELLQKSGSSVEQVFKMMEEAIKYDARESFRILCDGQLSICMMYLRYAACVGLRIAFDDDAREAAFQTQSVKEAIRYAVQKSNHYERFVFSPYRMRNMDEEGMNRKIQNDTFLDCVIGRIVRELTPNKKNPGQLHDWYQDLGTENQSNWTSLYVGNVTKNCKQELQDKLSRYGTTECNILTTAEYSYSLNRYSNWMAPIFAMADLQDRLLTGISPPDGWLLDVKPKLKDRAFATPKAVKNHGASIEFQRVLACGPTGVDDVLISVPDELNRRGLKRIKRLDRMSDLTVKKLDAGYDAKKNQEHADKSDEKGLNVYRLVGKPQVLNSVLERARLILVANRDCLVALSKTEWDERVKICAYEYQKNGFMVTHLKRGFPDEFVDGNRKKELGTTMQEYRGNRYQNENYVPNYAAAAAPNNTTRDFLTLNEVILQNDSGFIKMLVCTEIDGELDGELCEIKYKDSAIDQDYDKKADWCLFSRLAGHNLKLRVGEKRGNSIISHDFTVNQLLEDPKVKAIYDKKVNLMFDNVKKVIANSRAGMVYVADLGSLNPEYYKVLGDVDKYSELYEGKPLIPYELLHSLDQFGRRGSFCSED